MSDQAENQIDKMDPEHLRAMTKAMNKQFYELKQKVEQDTKLAAEAQKKREQQEAQQKEEHAKMSAELENLREFRDVELGKQREYHAKTMANEIMPYLEQLQKAGEKDNAFTGAVGTFRDNLNKGLENAFTDANANAQMQTIRAAASAHAVTTSKLDELFQSQKAHEEQVAKLEAEKKELEDKANTLQTSYDHSKEEFDKLQKELETLRAKADANISNPESHLEKVDDKQQPTTVAATASSNYYNGFETLFNFEPRASWREIPDKKWDM